MTGFPKYLISSVFFILQGCSQSALQFDAEQPYPPSKEPQIGDILHTSSGHYIGQQQLFNSLAHYPLVYVGEVHDNPASHRLELEILKAMQLRHPGQFSLGMEMFNSEQQPALDLWVAGELNEKEFLRKSRWYENWGGDFELYRELLEYCRDHRIAVIGLNATRETGRKVSMTALHQLDSEVREMLPEMDMSDPYQRQMVKAIFGSHGVGATLLESFQRRQTLWDETMAESVANFMRENQERRMVVVAGGWHINYGFGIPRRVHRRLPIPYVSVGGHNLVIPEQKRDQLMDVEIPEFPMPAVDYLVYQQYEIFKPRGVRLGVGLDDSDDRNGLLITEVEPGSVANLAGIKKGDRLLQIDDSRLQENFDLIYSLKTRYPGSQASLELKRDDKTLVVEVDFLSGKHK